MNLLEHYVEKIYSVKDITEEFEKVINEKSKEKLYLIDMDIDCYGVKERIKKQMFETEYKNMLENGYYMA